MFARSQAPALVVIHKSIWYAMPLELQHRLHNKPYITLNHTHLCRLIFQEKKHE